MSVGTSSTVTPRFGALALAFSLLEMDSRLNGDKLHGIVGEELHILVPVVGLADILGHQACVSDEDGVASMIQILDCVEILMKAYALAVVVGVVRR